MTQLEGDDARFKQRFASLVKAIPQLVWLSADSGQWTWSSPRWAAYTGLTAEMSQGDGWYKAVHPDDRAATEAAWQSAMLCGVLDVEHRLLGSGQPEVARWFHTQGTPVSDAQGQGREWLGTCTDVHETRLLEERQRRLLEMQHRHVCDVLALTRLVARQTAKASQTVEDYALQLDSRLDAIARTQAMMLRDIKAGVDLEHLVSDVLLAYAAHEGDHVRISGPSLALRGTAAGLLGLTLHELAMNAVKHGALSPSPGHISVTWSLEQTRIDRVLCLEWVETGTSVSDGSQRHKGFGSQLIERILKQELNATASLSFDRHGVQCVIVLPCTDDIAASGARSRE